VFMFMCRASYVTAVHGKDKIRYWSYCITNIGSAETTIPSPGFLDQSHQDSEAQPPFIDY
jgi:hypothetical protein